MKTLDLIPQPEPLCYTPVSHPTEVPMRLIGLAVVLAVILTLALLAAGAQQTEKVRRIGFRSGTNPNYEVDDALFRQILRCIQRPCDIRAAQAISLSGDRFQKALAKLKGLSHT